MRGASPSRSPAEGSFMRGASPSRSPASRSAFVEDALAVRLSDSGRQAPFRLTLTTIRGTRPPNVDISDRNALHDVIDRG